MVQPTRLPANGSYEFSVKEIVYTEWESYLVDREFVSLIPSSPVNHRKVQPLASFPPRFVPVSEEAGQIFRDFAHHSGAQIFTSPESLIFRS